MKFIRWFVDSINRFRENSAVKELRSQLAREKLRSSDLSLELQLKQEELKVNELAIAQLRAIIERDLQRVKAESAIATYQYTRLGMSNGDRARQSE